MTYLELLNNDVIAFHHDILMAESTTGQPIPFQLTRQELLGMIKTCCPFLFEMFGERQVIPVLRVQLWQYNIDLEYTRFSSNFKQHSGYSIHHCR